jgi:hypothetical protein
MKVEDKFGVEFGAGDKVLFATDARNSGINYGVVLDVYEYQPQYHNRTVTKVKVRYLTDDDEETTEIRWDSVTQKHYDTGKLTRPSILEYSPGKFVKR